MTRHTPPNALHDAAEPVHPLEPTIGELTAVLAQDAAVSEVLPMRLSEKLIADGEAMIARAPLVAHGSSARHDGAQAPSLSTARGSARGSARRRTALVWTLATAAGLAVLLPQLAPSFRMPWQQTDAADATQAAAPASQLSAAALLSELRADSTVRRVAWAPSEDPAAASVEGEVWWDAVRQRGVLRIRGLVPNDPRLAQYQLWIVDADRDARYPVDGGVFDILSNGEVLVMIDARVPVRRATLFAVTLEQPGGVVVSTRERLVLTAAVGS